MRLLLFLLFPALELYLLVKVGSRVGAFNMVAWVFLSAFIGIWAVRNQGQAALRNAQAQMAEGKVPQNNFLEGVMLFFGGLLLILPGLISDVVGLFLLVPDIRRFLAAKLGLSMAEQRAEHPGQWGGASRIIFYSSGFPGGFGRGASSMNGMNDMEGDRGGPFFERGPRGQFAGDDEDDSPRQATIIESTAIDITAKSGGDSSAGSSGNPSGGSSGGQGAAGSSPDCGRRGKE
ncbi:FxsA family protein [Desulfovibrio sp. OttesenSCG-928-G15]|nr:FxsA family protein [Desulfovibrio sp. OttesenSCG-928-G15]